MEKVTEIILFVEDKKAGWESACHTLPYQSSGEILRQRKYQIVILNSVFLSFYFNDVLFNLIVILLNLERKRGHHYRDGEKQGRSE